MGDYYRMNFFLCAKNDTWLISAYLYSIYNVRRPNTAHVDFVLQIDKEINTTLYHCIKNILRIKILLHDYLYNITNTK